MKIIPLSPDHLPRAADVIERAFRDDPIVSALLPDKERRMGGMTDLYREVLRYVLHFGEAYTTPQVDGVANWMPPGRYGVTLGGLIRTRFGLARAALSMPFKAWPRSAGLLTWVEWAHARLRRPHWYLWVLGVDPDRQGRGVGGALIAPVLKRADENRLPCYLETETESNLAFYEKRGFRVRVERAFPRLGVRVWTMLREPVAS